MCFSAEASAAAAVALLPVGAYCLATAWRKDRAYLPLATVPLIFGLQQVCEACVWRALDRGDAGAARVPSLMFLFFALAAWPVWSPLAAAAIEPGGWKRRALFALVGAGVLFALAYYLPILSGGGRALNPAVVGHSIRYDLSGVPAAGSGWGWAWAAVYLVAACGPMLASQERRLWPLGVAVVLAAAIAYALFAYTFTSVWCFFAAILSLYVAFVLYRLPEPQLGVSSAEKRPDDTAPRAPVAGPHGFRVAARCGLDAGRGDRRGGCLGAVRGIAGRVGLGPVPRIARAPFPRRLGIDTGSAPRIVRGRRCRALTVLSADAADRLAQPLGRRAEVHVVVRGRGTE